MIWIVQNEYIFYQWYIIKFYIYMSPSRHKFESMTENLISVILWIISLLH